MTTMLFVHGTGVRYPADIQTLKIIDRSLHIHPRAHDITVELCSWGTDFGAKLNLGGKSIPSADTSRGFDGEDNVDWDTALWAQLYRDPLFELKLQSLSPNVLLDFRPGQADLSALLNDRFQHYALNGAQSPALIASGLDLRYIDAARKYVLTTPEYQAFLGVISQESDDETFAGVLARSVIAMAMRDCMADGNVAPILIDADIRDRAVQTISAQLSDGNRGIGTELSTYAFKVALAMGALNSAERKRAALTDVAFPYPGDVLLYQTRGAAIRARIRDCIAQYQTPILLLAHSLGSVACVDLLVEDELSQVKMLITVGSQVPFFYEINALNSLPYDKPLPEHFPRWLNIYDARDFLGYVAEDVFPNRVRDARVNNRQPFPRAHAAYWTNPNMWAEVLLNMPS